MSFMLVAFEETVGINSGYELRNRANVKDLSIFLNDAEPVVFAVHPAPKGTPRPLARTLRALDRDDIRRMLDTVTELRPSFVLVEGVLLLEAIEALRHAFPRIPLVLDMHNVESLLQIERDSARVPLVLRPLADLVNRRKHRAAREADRHAISLASMVWTCSESDAALAARHFPTPELHVVANPVPDWCATVPDRPPVAFDALAPDPVILYVGHLGYSPNRRAVERLCTEIMPALRCDVPQARLHVCGRSPSGHVREAVAAAGHRLTANPPDLAPHYAEAMITAIPLSQGGGTRIKVLEALAVGCPVVASAKAVEGLALHPGRDYIAAESSAEFAAALAALIADPTRRAALSAAGRALVTARYAPPARQASIARALAGLTVRSPADSHRP